MARPARFRFFTVALLWLVLIGAMIPFLDGVESYGSQTALLI